MGKRELVGVRLPPWQLEQLDQIARGMGITPSALARQFVINGLNGQTILERHLMEQADKEQSALDLLAEKVHRIEALAFASLDLASKSIDKDLKANAARGGQIRDDWAATRAKSKQPGDK